MSDFADQFTSALRESEAAFGLREGFVQGVGRDGDDWSFVVKSHALLEACVSEILIAAIGDKRVRPVVHQLDLSDTKRGKIALARDLGLLTKGHIEFIRKFSELRNTLVHNVHNTAFTFRDHLAMLDSNQRKAFRKAAVAWAGAMAQEKYARWFDETPKAMLFLGVAVLLIHAHSAITKAGARREQIKRALEWFEENPPDDALDFDAS